MISTGPHIAAVLLAFAWALLDGAYLTATPPDPPPYDALTLPDAPLPVPPSAQDRPGEREAISRILRGESHAADDPHLSEGIRELLLGTRSILAGSSLNPEYHPQGVRRADRPSTPHRLDARLRTAEMLLKTSRLLDKLQPTSENQSQLVSEMRNQAARLMQNALQKNDQASGFSRQNSTREIPALTGGSSPNSLRQTP